MRMTVEQARRFRNITTSKMADALGISRVTYEKREKNPKQFSIEQIEKISKIVDVKKENIFFEEEQKEH